jgi:SAM-dependent methyltransferase
MTYDPAIYWTERGSSYAESFNPELYVEQERAIEDALAGLDFWTVLEVGCGFGRIARLLQRVRPGAVYVGIDISKTMLAARGDAPGYYVASSLADYHPAGRFDLVLAVEFLMHQPPDDVAAAVDKLRRLAHHHVVTVDWTEPVDRQTAAHNFRHDYDALLDVRRASRVGAQTIYVSEPLRG